VNYCKNEIVERDEIKLISGKNVKYVVPQKIKYTDFENITLYLRVEKEQRDVDITIKDFNNNIYIKKERIVKPAEMLKINLSKKSLESVENKELCIDIRCSNEK
jgi:hypothetical protein